jgi:lysophospholipase L1-like esterase
MKRILAFGDSNTLGYIPGTFNWVHFTYEQYSPHQRWTGILQKALGSQYKVIEDGVPGRTIMTEDLNTPGTSGLRSLKTCLAENNSLDLVIIMLGTNDLKSIYQLPPKKITEQMKNLCQFIRANPKGIEKAPQILLVSPPQIKYQQLCKEFLLFYEDPQVENESIQLATDYEKLAKAENYWYCNGSLIFSEKSDGLHLDSYAHQCLAAKLKTIIVEKFSICHK